MTADLTGYLRAVRLYTERARAIYAAAIEEPYTPPASDEEAITRAGEAMIEFARSLVEMHEPWPNPADFGIGTEPITLAGCEPDIILSAKPLGQEATMDSQRFTAEDLRRAHWQMQDDILRYLSDRVHKFQADTGLVVQGVEVEFATMARVGEPAQNIVARVDVRVGLGR
ncbi:hypothetical protein [Quisquiliibacterium transsilvanicum]|uniref:Uncharacterized protein n=1 Tax=Quisquiliibacterium transsilvanicum TaxID=1549638 RepID=A0A7W8M8K0_9BURK|nr:hypothetical protein [Quisquiliibacterium transsilvanicum]MBB5271375.1 hypothetical protein [Quisquiliibacterium transsilvanicum]